MSVAGASAAVTGMVVMADGRRMRLADEETLRYFLSRPLRPPPSAELMRRLGLDDGEVDTLLRALRNEKNVRRIHADVLRQYKAKGHAYIEVPEEEGYPDDDGMDEQAEELK